MLSSHRAPLSKGKRSADFDLAFLSQVIRRRWRLMFSIVLICFALGVGFVAFVPASYRSTTRILISPPLINLFNRDSVVSDIPVNILTVETQVEVIKSEAVVHRVVEKLKLQDDPELTRPAFYRQIATAFLTSLGFPPPDPPEEQRILFAIGGVQSSMTVQRVSPTFVVEVSFDSRQSQKAAMVTNEIGAAYLAEGLQAKSNAAASAGQWLQERLAQLREQAVAASQAVETFKTENNIVDASGKLITDQQLSEINTQLTTAEAQAGEAQARLTRIQEVLESGVSEAAGMDSLRNDIITSLRKKYLEKSQREAYFSARVGQNHMAVVRLRDEMRETHKALTDELLRSMEMYKSDYQIAIGRVESLRKSLLATTALVAGTRQLQVKLRELESEAQTTRAIYDTFLQRGMQTTQQETEIAATARIITPAVASGVPSFPNWKLILPGSLVMGFLFGFGIAGLREMLDKIIRTPRQLERLANVKCLGLLPELAKNRSLSFSSPHKKEILERVAIAPASRFAETIRSIKVAADVSDMTHRPSVIAVTSAVKGEGKSTVCANLTRLIASTRNSVLLVDCDMRNPSLSRNIRASEKDNLIDVLIGRGSLYGKGGMHFLASGAEKLPYGYNTFELLGSQAMASLVDRAKDLYNYVILDLPPLIPLVDVRACANLADAFVLVVRWGETSESALKEALGLSPIVHDRLLGTILNRVNLKKINRFKEVDDVIYPETCYSNYGDFSSDEILRGS
jgi:polysaccharide biosynthesis transport protein